MFEMIVLIVAGFAAGVLNAVAGGGTFLTFPALVFAGVPPVMANATATLTALPGYAGSAWGYRRDLRAEGSLPLRAIIVTGLLGALAGAGLLMITTDRVFGGLVPWLLVLATVLFAAGPRIIAAARRRGRGDAGPVLSAVVLLAVCTYGGYFNGGLGIMLLAALGLLGYGDLHNMNGIKNMLSAAMAVISAVAFIAAGLIAWKAAVPMALATTLGGLAGAHYSRKITNTAYLRAFVILVGVVMSAIFFAV